MMPRKNWNKANNVSVRKCQSLRDCLKQAFLKRSLGGLYFDNGRVFRSQALLRLCATLGIHLIHSRPYRPRGAQSSNCWTCSSAGRASSQARG